MNSTRKALEKIKEKFLKNEKFRKINTSLRTILSANAILSAIQKAQELTNKNMIINLFEVIFLRQILHSR